MPANKLKNLLNSSKNSELADMVERAHAMGELASQLSAALPAEFAQSIAAANIRPDDELVIIAASPAWAARLRFEEKTLAAAAEATGHTVTRVRVRVSQQP